MAYKLVVSEEAYKDIDDIVHYIAVELVNPTAAASFVDDVEKSYFAVVDNPRMYAYARMRDSVEQDIEKLLSRIIL